MQRGCIAVENIRCDECGRTIKPPERYLVTDEVEGEEKKKLFYCVDCCLNKGYAYYKKGEKGAQILTFFTREI